jgi:hypothetical protein
MFTGADNTNEHVYISYRIFGGDITQVLNFTRRSVCFDSFNMHCFLTQQPPCPSTYSVVWTTPHARLGVNYMTSVTWAS